MASDQATLLVLALALNYILLYRKNGFLGSIGFLIIGVGSIKVVSNYGMLFGTILIALSIISILYEIGRKAQKG